MENSFNILLGSWFLFFFRGLFLGHVVDDVVRIKVMQDIYSKFKWNLTSIKSVITNGFYGAGLFLNPRIDHAFTLVIHLINCLLINRMVGGELGFWSALLYMLTPVNNQTVLWLNGRRYQLTILAVLLAWNFKILGFVLYPFMAWLHVSGIAFPALLAFTPEWKFIILGIVIAVLCGWNRIFDVLNSRLSDFTNPKDDINECQKITWKKALIYVKSIGWYVQHIALPLKPMMYHEFLYYFSRYEEGKKKGYSLDAQFWFGLLVLGGLITQIVMGGPGAFWAGWFLIFISQWCNVYTVTMHVADRYCSLAGVGLMVLICQNILLLPSPFQYIAFTAMIMMYAMTYAPLFRAYTSYGEFLRYHVWINPAGVNARHVLALNYLHCSKPDPMSAYFYLKDGLRLRPHDFKLLVTMAQVMFMIGKIENGFKLLDRAEKVVPLGEEEDCKVEFAQLREHFNKVLESEKMKRQILAKEKGYGRGVNPHLADLVK